MMRKIKKLFLISRPVSWLNTAYPFAAGYVVSGGNMNTTFLVGTLFFLIPYNLLMYGINDIFDYESDIRNPRKGGLEGAKEQKAFHPVIWQAIAITNIPFVVWLFVNGPAISNVILGFVLFFVIAYSIKYLRFKEIPILDSITSSLHFTGPLVYALVMTGGLAVALPFVVAFFLWGMASHAFGAIQDIAPDRQAGLASIATIFGGRATAIITFILYLASASIVMLQGYPAAIVGVAGVMYAVNVAPFLRVTDSTSELTNKGWRRFIWLNYVVGFVLTITLIVSFIK